jgi:hypothetical protein
LSTEQTTLSARVCDRLQPLQQTWTLRLPCSCLLEWTFQLILLTGTPSCPSCFQTQTSLRFQSICGLRCAQRSSTDKLLGGASRCLSTTTESAQDRTVATDITSIKRTTTSSQCATCQGASTATSSTPSVSIMSSESQCLYCCTVVLNQRYLLGHRSPMEQRNDLREHTMQVAPIVALVIALTAARDHAG